MQVIVPDTRPDVFLLDVRKFIHTEDYSGPTRKGIRLPIDHVDALAGGLAGMADSFQEWTEGRTGLFAAPGETEDADDSGGADITDGIPDHLKRFF